MFLEVLGCHPELFEEQFAEIRGGCDADHIADIPDAVAAILYQLGGFLELDGAYDFDGGEAEDRLDFPEQSRTAHVELFAEDVDAEVLVGDMFLNQRARPLYEFAVSLPDLGVALGVEGILGERLALASAVVENRAD